MKMTKRNPGKTERQLQNFFAIEKQVDYSIHLRQTIESAQSVRQTHSPRSHISFQVLVLKQLKFVALKIWLLQGMILSALCAQFLFYYDRDVIRISEYIPRGTLALYGCVIALSARPLLLRPMRYRMLEIEQSTYFSNRGGILAQLLFIGIGDTGMLAVLAFLAIHHRIAADTIFLFLVIPFLTASAAGLMLWTRTTFSFYQKAWIPVCIVSSYLVCETAKRSLAIPQNMPLVPWICYAFLCVYVLCREYRRLYWIGSMEKLHE